MHSDKEYCTIDLSGKTTCTPDNSTLTNFKRKINNLIQQSKTNSPSKFGYQPILNAKEALPFESEDKRLILVYSKHCPHCHKLVNEIKPIIQSGEIYPVMLEKNTKLASRLLTLVNENRVPLIILAVKRPNKKGYFFCTVEKDGSIEKCFLYKNV